MSFVASSADCEMSTRGPKPMPVASRSGSLESRVRIAKFVSPMRMTSPSLRVRRASSASSTAAPNIPSRSPSASSSDMGGVKTAWPIRGHDGSTALISISAASPLDTLAMPRKVATVDSEPCVSRKRCSSAERRRWMSANDASPPSITRPSRPMPSLSARARLSTPTIAATPSAMQRRKMRKPARPPRRSRKAKRMVGARLGRAMSPVAGAFTNSFSLGEKATATPFSLVEKVADAVGRMRESHQRSRRALRPNPHPQPLSRWRGGRAGASTYHREPQDCSCRKRRRGNRLVFDPARTHADHSVATRGERGVMRDKRERRSAPCRQIEHHVDDGAAGCLIEIAGRLVRDQQRWPGRERAGQRYALLLASRQLRRIVREAVGETHLLEFGPCALGCVAYSGELERRGDVFERGHGRNQVKGLEHDADALAAKAREGVFVQGAELDAVDLNFAFIWSLKTGHDHEQRRLARPGRPDYADRLAFADCQIDVAQDMHASRAAAETEVDGAHRDRRKHHCPSTLKPSRPHMGICGSSSRRWPSRRPWR